MPYKAGVRGKLREELSALRRPDRRIKPYRPNTEKVLYKNMIKYTDMYKREEDNNYDKDREELPG